MTLLLYAYLFILYADAYLIMNQSSSDHLCNQPCNILLEDPSASTVWPQSNKQQCLRSELSQYEDKQNRKHSQL